MAKLTPCHGCGTPARCAKVLVAGVIRHLCPDCHARPGAPVGGRKPPCPFTEKGGHYLIADGEGSRAAFRCRLCGYVWCPPAPLERLGWTEARLGGVA